jgi:hypothetical protein
VLGVQPHCEPRKHFQIDMPDVKQIALDIIALALFIWTVIILAALRGADDE